MSIKFYIIEQYYISILEDLNIKGMFQDSHKSRKLQRIVLKYDEKYYLCDLGFRQAIIGNNQRDITRVIEGSF